MAQADYIISNQTFPNTRADINSHLQAIATNNSGTSAPTTQYAGQFWIDTTSSTWTMYIHDGSDDIAFATIDTSANTVNFTDSALDVVTDTTPQLGGNLDLNSNDITGTGNINITGTGTFSGNLTVDTNTLYVDSTNNRVLIGDTSVTDASASAKIYSKTGYGIITNNNENAGGIKLSSSSTNALIFQADPNNQRASTEMYFNTDGSERMKIDTSYNLLVGDSSVTDASNGAKVYSKTGFGIITTNNENAGGVRLVSSAQNSVLVHSDPNNERADSFIGFNVDGTRAMHIDDSFNVGINTTSPTEKLDVNGTVKATQFVGGGLNAFRNLIINGDMSIAQRGTSVTGISSGNTYHTVDRFATELGGLGTWTQTQSTDVPTGQGFAKSLKMDCTTADASPSVNDYAIIKQKVEGQNLQYLKKGTSNAESVTMSFWVKSNKTGTYIVELADRDNTRKISQAYTINSSDTWEKKILVYAGDTSGAFDNDNGGSLDCYFWLGAGTNFTSGTLNTSWSNPSASNRAAGQVNLADSTSNEWYITGVQLEAGTSASDFEFLPHDVNLQRCQRYYWHFWSKDEADNNGAIMGTGIYTSTSTIYIVDQYVTQMRAVPTLDQTSGTDYYRTIAGDLLDDFVIQTDSLNKTTNKGYQIYNNTDASGTTGNSSPIRCNNTDAYVAFDAEL